MLTITCQPAVSETTSSAQNDTPLSDLEISRRVLRIRSQWTIGERIRRRREAVERGVTTMSVADLPADGLLVEVRWSSVNYKDGLASTPAGRVSMCSQTVSRRSVHDCCWPSVQRPPSTCSTTIFFLILPAIC